jgi:hypothetical protein
MLTLSVRSKALRETFRLYPTNLEYKKSKEMDDDGDDDVDDDVDACSEDNAFKFFIYLQAELTS